jgi:cyclase
MSVRIIPKLDIKGPNLVKGIHFEGLRVMGKPEDFARYYYQHGADELIYMDAVASLYGRNSLLEIVERTSREIFIPLCVGGGLRSVEDIRAVLRAGADKVSLNTAAIQNPELIRTAARMFGSSTVVVSIEAIRHAAGQYEAFVEYGRQETGVDALEWAQRAEALGAGELMVTSINQEGTGEGFDLELTRRMAESVSIPVIAAGGAGSLQQVAQVIQEGKADAVSIASLLHYNVVRQQAYAEEQFAAEGNVEFLQGRRGGAGFSKIQETTLPALKAYLAAQGIDVRQQQIEPQA